MREGGDVLTVDNTARILGLDNDEAAKALARWRNHGWLARIKRGVYITVPLEARNAAQALEDAWILVPELFAPV
jgi:predicted transcriptional regulator of viral defense system